MSALREALRSLPEAVFADLLESDDAYLLVVDLPGATADSTDVEVEDGRLRIEARREKSVPADYRYLREDRSLFLDAELPLPPDAAYAHPQFDVERGVLEVTIPRGEGGETTIEVTGPGNSDADADSDSEGGSDSNVDGDSGSDHEGGHRGSGSDADGRRGNGHYGSGDDHAGGDADADPDGEDE